MIMLASAASAIRFDQLHLSPVALDLGFFQLRWYALSYIAMILIGWWYLTKLLQRSGAPMARRHLDDLVFYATFGIILGGRLGYCLFYRPEIWLHPLDVLKLWEGGMSLHGGFIGVIIALWLFARRHQLSMLRICDYFACATPFGLILVRLANFVNGELWGRPSSLPWAMIFPGSRDGIPRHPSQLYEALLEGGLTMVVLVYLFWRTDARLRPGRLTGTGLVLYGTARFLLEFVRQPDAGLEHLWWGLTMGQTLSAPMMAVGAWLLVRSGRSPGLTLMNTDARYQARPSLRVLPERQPCVDPAFAIRKVQRALGGDARQLTRIVSIRQSASRKITSCGTGKLSA